MVNKQQRFSYKYWDIAMSILEIIFINRSSWISSSKFRFVCIVKLCELLLNEVSPILISINVILNRGIFILDNFVGYFGELSDISFPDNSFVFSFEFRNLVSLWKNNITLS